MSVPLEHFTSIPAVPPAGPNNVNATYMRVNNEVHLTVSIEPPCQGGQQNFSYRIDIDGEEMMTTSRTYVIIPIEEEYLGDVTVIAIDSLKQQSKPFTTTPRESSPTNPSTA